MNFVWLSWHVKNSSHHTLALALEPFAKLTTVFASNLFDKVVAASLGCSAMHTLTTQLSRRHTVLASSVRNWWFSSINKIHSDSTEADSSPPPASSWRWTAFGFFSTTIEIETLSSSPMFILWVWAVIVVALPTRKEDWALCTRVKMTLKTSIVKRKMKSRSVSNMAQLTTLGGTVQQWCPWAKHFARLSFTFHLLFILVSLEEVTDFVTQLPTPVYVPNVKWQKATI